MKVLKEHVPFDIGRRDFDAGRFVVDFGRDFGYEVDTVRQLPATNSDAAVEDVAEPAAADMAAAVNEEDNKVVVELDTVDTVVVDFALVLDFDTDFDFDAGCCSVQIHRRRRSGVERLGE